MYSSGAYDLGIAKLKFTSDNYEYERLGYCESSDNGVSFFINNEPCTEETFDTLFDEHSIKNDAVWYEFSQESIETELSNDKYRP